MREVAEWSTSTSQRHLPWGKKGPFKGFFHPQTPMLQANGIEQLLGCRRVGNPWVNMAEKKHLTVKEAVDLLMVNPVIIHRKMREGRLNPIP